MPIQETATTLSYRIRQLRTLHHETIAALSESTGISSTRLKKVEALDLSACRHLTLNDCTAIASHYGVSVMLLFFPLL